MPPSNKNGSTNTATRQTLKRKKPRSKLMSADDADETTGLGDTPFEMPDAIPRDPGKVRVVSWNMQGASTSYEDITRAKAETIVSVLDNVKPHVFLLQEVPGGEEDYEAFKTALNKSMKRKRSNTEYAIEDAYDRDGAGQRYMAISESGTTVNFGDLAEYNATSLFAPKEGEGHERAEGKRKIKPVSKLSTEEEDVANHGKKPRMMTVSTAEGDVITMSTWHAPYGNGQSAPLANSHYSRYLSGKDAAEHPDVLVGDLNINKRQVQATYKVGRQSLASGNLDHVVGFNGVSVQKVAGLPTKKSLKDHYTFQVSDHTMIAADIILPRKTGL